MGALDGIVAAIAGRQHGVIARRQVLAAGVSRGSIANRLTKGSLIRVFPGVYRVGHSAPSVEATYMAAVLACGEGAVLGGRAAAFLLGLIRGKAPGPSVHTRAERQIDGIATRRARQMDPRDITTWKGIPVTTPARTLVDLAESFSPDELARAMHQADVLHRTTPDDVEAVLGRRPTSKGAAKLREVIHGDQGRILSKLERAFIRLLKQNNLPLPTTNRPAGGLFVDCRWPERKLTVELDGYRYHRSRHAWQKDRKRERDAYARGDQFRRYTWGDVVEHPAPTLSELRAVLIPV
ncbi:MAG TPA: type IV toxin-antitoxin system AbiEi family antitoxin domain-containing protein [Gaiellaceae bacterium]